MELLTEETFEQVYRDTYSRLFYLAYDIVGDEESARDIVGEVFVSVWKNHRNVGYSNLKGFLYVSVRNKSYSWYKHHLQVNQVPVEMASSLSDIGETWQSREGRISLLEAEIAQLPERTQYILDSCYREHASQREVAERLGITVNGVKKQLARAIKQLRERMGSRADEGRMSLEEDNHKRN